MQLSNYRVTMGVFEGPLDLLLYLVRKNEVDVSRLPIAKITSEFVEYLEVLEILDFDFIGDFVVLASTLVEIKSREVLPRPEEDVDDDDTEDSTQQSELIRQLLQYKRYKDAATALEQRAAEWQERYPRLHDDRPSRGKNPSEDRIKEVELWDLVSALSRVLRTTMKVVEAKIRYDETPISVYVEQIGQRVRDEKRVSFSSCFDKSDRRSKIVNIFLAILELLRHHSFRGTQEVDFGEIWIEPPLEEGESPASSPTRAHDGEPESATPPNPQATDSPTDATQSSFVETSSENDDDDSDGMTLPFPTNPFPPPPSSDD